jgi:hypothetical protein
MADVMIFLLAAVVLLFIFGVAKNRSANRPSSLTLTKDDADGIMNPVFFDSAPGSSHPHGTHCDHHATVDTGAHHSGFDAGHFDAGGGHH